MMSLSPADIANCNACECAMDVSTLPPFTNVRCPECGEHNRVKTDVGSYILMKRQGFGGMSLVFGAVDKTLGREVAIKILNEEYSMDEKRIAQFELEARITAAMSHPHIVKVFTVGQAFSRFFIAMELVAGDSLEKKMSDNGKLSESDVLNWAQQISDGLNAANESGLIHRDIKPGNILFDKDGYVKIVDFGLALVTQGGKAQADEIWATPFYVPPEALDILEEDFRSDIYALGASLFHALSGKPPFETESRSTIELKEIKRNLPSLKTVAPWLADETCAVIDKAMAFEMEDRFSSYQALIDALHHAELVINHEGEHPPMSSAQRAKRRIKEKQHASWRIPAITGASVLLVGSLLFAVLKDDNSASSDEADSVVISQDGAENSAGTMTKRVGKEITLARGSLKNKNYKESARRYSEIASDSKVSKDTIYWAGLQSSTIHWLNGNSGEARKQLRELAILSNKEGNSGSETGRRLDSAVDSLTSFRLVDTQQFKVPENELDAMITFVSGLKNWSLGRVKEALELFEKVERYQADEPSVEYQFYRARIADYKYDADLVKELRGNYFPKSIDDLNQRVAKLQGLESKVRTKGRILFDLEEWHVQCDIHKKRLIREAKEALIKSNQENNNPEPEPVENQLKWKDFILEVNPDLKQYEFEKVEQLLKFENFADLKDKQRAEQFSYLCQKASGFKASVQTSLSEKKTNAIITLKVGGKEVSGISKVTNEGFEIIDAVEKRLVKWRDIEASSLVDLHKYNVADNLSDFEVNLRLEQAVCFAWLTGETTKAQNGARVLADANPIFKARWESCMELLGE